MLDQEQIQATRKENVLSALSQIASRFRTRVGESLITVEQHNTPLAEATTSSLEALKAYSMAWDVVMSEGSAAAIPLYKCAVEVDPQFAMAYGMLGRMYGDLGESVLSSEYTTKAWQLRGRASDSEKFFLSASYDTQVTGNVERAQQTCEAWAHAYPRDTRPDGFLSGMIYPVQGKYDQAIERARRTINNDPDFVFGYNILALEQIAVGDWNNAERTLHEADARKLEIPDLFMDRFQIAFLKGDQAEMDRVTSLTPRESGAEDWIAHLQSTALARAGRLHEATQRSQRAIDLARQHNQLERAALFQTEEAIRDAFYDDRPAAIQNAKSALHLSLGLDVEYGAAFALSLAGDTHQAQTLTEEIEKTFPENTAAKSIYMPEIRALIALNQHQPAKAIELLQATASYEQGEPPSSFFGFFGMFYPAYLRGEAYLEQKQGALAAVEFQKIIDHPGVVITDPIGALAHRQLGRAFVLAADTPHAKVAYEEFFNVWKNADQPIPIMEQARVEYAHLLR